MASELTNPVKLLILFRPRDKILRLSKESCNNKPLYANVINFTALSNHNDEFNKLVKKNKSIYLWKSKGVNKSLGQTFL